MIGAAPASIDTIRQMKRVKRIGTGHCLEEFPGPINWEESRTSNQPIANAPVVMAGFFPDADFPWVDITRLIKYEMANPVFPASGS